MKISVIIPVYNVAACLERCMASVLRQTCGELEILLVDDGSTDGSAQLCDRYGAGDGRVRVIHQPNQGLGCARNTGLAHATGEYVSFVDSDDYIDPTAYEQLLRYLADHPCDVCRFGHFRVWNGRAEPYDVPPEKTLYTGREETLGGLLCDTLLGRADHGRGFAGLSVWSALYKRSILEENRIRFLSEREILSEDFFFNLAAYAAARCVRIYPAHLYYYTFRPESLTGRYKADRFQDALRMDAALTRAAQALQAEPLLRDGIESALCMNLVVCMKQELRFERQNGRAAVIKRLRLMGSCRRVRGILACRAWQASRGRRLLQRSIQHRRWLCVYGILKIGVARETRRRTRR